MTVSAGSTLVGLWAFEIVRRGPFGIARSLGRALQTTDGRGADGPAIARAAFDHMAQWPDVQAVHLSRLEEGSAPLTVPGIARWATRSTKSLRMEVRNWPTNCANVPTLSSSRNKVLRRHRRRLTARGRSSSKR